MEIRAVREISSRGLIIAPCCRVLPRALAVHPLSTQKIYAPLRSAARCSLPGRQQRHGCGSAPNRPTAMHNCHRGTQPATPSWSATSQRAHLSSWRWLPMGAAKVQRVAAEHPREKRRRSAEDKGPRRRTPRPESTGSAPPATSRVERRAVCSGRAKNSTKSRPGGGKGGTRLVFGTSAGGG